MQKKNVGILVALPQMEELEGKGKTAMLMAIDDILAGIVAVADTVKETSAEAIRQLKKMGIEVIMITGDNRRTAEVNYKLQAILRADRILNYTFLLVFIRFKHHY